MTLVGFPLLICPDAFTFLILVSELTVKIVGSNEGSFQDFFDFSLSAHPYPFPFSSRLTGFYFLSITVSITYKSHQQLSGGQLSRLPNQGRLYSSDSRNR